MRNRFLITARSPLGLLAIPAIAFAVKFNTNVSARVNDDQDQIFGVVRSSDFACEKRRDVRLYGPDNSIINGSGKGNGDYPASRRSRPTASANTASGAAAASSEGEGLHPGEYFVRALRKDFPDASAGVTTRPTSSSKTTFRSGDEEERRMKRLALLGTLMAVTVVSATASADKLPDVVSIKADQYNCCTQEIFGSVKSPQPSASATARSSSSTTTTTPSAASSSSRRYDHDRHQGRVPVRQSNVDKNDAGKLSFSFPASTTSPV